MDRVNKKSARLGRWQRPSDNSFHFQTNRDAKMSRRQCNWHGKAKQTKAWTAWKRNQRIIPAPTVLLLLSSMIMKAPVPRFSA